MGKSIQGPRDTNERSQAGDVGVYILASMDAGHVCHRRDDLWHFVLILLHEAVLMGITDEYLRATHGPFG
eukprot:364589-Chlamydomonas_euryale.AAC.13